MSLVKPHPRLSVVSDGTRAVTWYCGPDSGQQGELSITFLPPEVKIVSAVRSAEVNERLGALIRETQEAAACQ